MGMFGGSGRAIAGSIGDFLLRQAGMQPIYGPAAQQQRELEQRMQIYQQQRQDSYDDWVRQQQWRKDNPDPAPPSEFARKYADMVRIVGQEEADKWAKSEANPMQWITADNPDGSKSIIPVPRNGFPSRAEQPRQSANDPASPGAASLMPSLIQQESGGRTGVLGPQTRYGQAQGLTQMLPGTAREMAGKLGLPWRPDLMTGTSPEAAQYQQQLGQAYLQEGFDRHGNARDALRYYHGGPNQKLWGPKTDAYADAVLSRAGRGSQTATGPVRVTNQAELASLPSGATYIAPDGSVRRKR